MHTLKHVIATTLAWRTLWNTSSPRHWPDLAWTTDWNTFYHHRHKSDAQSETCHHCRRRLAWLSLTHRLKLVIIFRISRTQPDAHSEIRHHHPRQPDSARVTQWNTSSPTLVWLSLTHTLRAPLSVTFLQTLPDLVTPLKLHSLSPPSCPCIDAVSALRKVWVLIIKTVEAT